MKIDGKTEKVGLLGYPVSHSFSPPMHNAAFSFFKMNYVYTAFNVNPANIKDAVRGLSALGFIGVNVTVPHKEAVIPFIDILSEEARTIGAVNTIKIVDGRYEGYNTDAYGFSAAIKKAFSTKLSGKKIFVIGAGGGAKAVVTRCAVEGAQKVVVTDIAPEKAKDLILHISDNLDDACAQYVKAGSEEMKEALSEANIVVNATPLGMKKDDPLPVDASLFKKGQKVFDLIYNPLKTKLMTEGEKRGCIVSNGLMMLLYQGMKSFEIWTGKKPPEDVMRRELERRVFQKK